MRNASRHRPGALPGIMQVAARLHTRWLWHRAVYKFNLAAWEFGLTAARIVLCFSKRLKELHCVRQGDAAYRTVESMQSLPLRPVAAVGRRLVRNVFGHESEHLSRPSYSATHCAWRTYLHTALRGQSTCWPRAILLVCRTMRT